LIRVFPKEVLIKPVYMKKTLQFKNIYPNWDPNNRIQKADFPYNPLKVRDLSPVDLEGSDAIILGPLSPSDIPLETVEYLSKFQVPLYLGVQGYLRHLEGDKIVLRPWKNFQKFLKYIRVLSLDENEIKVIIGRKPGNIELIAKKITSFGPEEVVITHGGRGATIYSGERERLYKISAVKPHTIKGPTGLGDTFMAAYAAKKFETSDPERCGISAAVVTAMKLEMIGAFRGSRKQIEERILNIHKNI
jgi:sugar/nucleoside kinase (ribokinase family)